MTTTEVRETEFSQNCFEVLVKAQEQNNTLLTYVFVPSAYVLINCELGYEDQTVNDLNKLTGVDATRLDGAYDIIAKINAESTESLTKI
jgi:hypothetical protein